MPAFTFIATTCVRATVEDCINCLLIRKNTTFVLTNAQRGVTLFEISLLAINMRIANYNWQINYDRYLNKDQFKILITRNFTVARLFDQRKRMLIK